MMRTIDYYLDRITMYRLVLITLCILVGSAFILSILHQLSLSPFAFTGSVLLLLITCWVSNHLFSWAFQAPTNPDSAFITALILALIMTPADTLSGYISLFWVATLAMASKFMLSFKKKHIFNPAAVAVVFTGFFLQDNASWWVGTAFMMPFVAICGFLIIRKMRFEDMAWSFFSISIVTCLVITTLQNGDVITACNNILLRSSMLFLGTFMLTEPLTLPPTKRKQIMYGALVGFLSFPRVQIFGISFAPEFALCISNIFAYLVSPKEKLVLFLREKIQISKDCIDFVFTPAKPFAYLPGQYMEWTLPHNKPDSRGSRRYFTLASSPTENMLRLGVKFYVNSSTYKKALENLSSQTPFIAAQLAGDFVLPKEKEKKLVFIAGGIGITPFRSMLKYLIDKKEQRDITVLYANKSADEILYMDVLQQAEKQLGTKIMCTLSQEIPQQWTGLTGRVTEAMIQNHISDYTERLFYISGPYTMVVAVENVLKHIGIPNKHIKKDFFPGLV